MEIIYPNYSPTVSVSTAAQLRSIPLTGIVDKTIAVVGGQNSAADGVWTWNATSTETDDGLTVITPTNVVTGRWIQVIAANASEGPGSVASAFTTIGEFYEAIDGDNWRPATQRAINYAIANDIAKVVRGTMPSVVEMWDQVTPNWSAWGDNTHSLAWYYGHKLLVVSTCDALDIDFGGAEITLKGPTGAARWPGQAITDVGLGPYYLGGFISVSGPVKSLRIANVKVDGEYDDGGFRDGSGSSLYDKGIGIQDLAGCEFLMTENVQLYNFGGEIFYDNCFARHVTRDCIFDGSPQSAWNPNVRAEVVAYNVQAGNSRQPAEVTGLNHTYYGGRFYDAGSGVTFISGVYDPDYPYSIVFRDNTLAPPFITFHGTRFERCNFGFGSWIRGNIVTVDSLGSLTYSVGHLTDIDLTVDAWADTALNNSPAVQILGPPTLTTQITSGPTGQYYSKTSNINLRVNVNRTAACQALSHMFSAAIELVGLLDKTSCNFTVSGSGASYAYLVTGTPPAGFDLPKIDVRNWTSLTAAVGGGLYTPMTAHTAFKPIYNTYTLAPTGSYNATIDLTYGYVEGQEVTFSHDNTGGSANIVSFAKNGTGMRLGADRTIRRAGEFITLRYSGWAGLFIEVAYLDQGV